MNSILFNFCFIWTFCGIWSFQFDQRSTTNVNFSILINLFSRENFPKVLESISAEALSEKCLQSTNSFGQKASNPVVGLTDGYWSLKSKSDFTVTEQGVAAQWLARRLVLVRYQV